MSRCEGRKRPARSHRFDDFVGLGAKMVARDGVEIGAGDADHPGLLRVRCGTDKAGRIGFRLTRAEHVLPGFFRHGLRLRDHFRGRLLAAGKTIVEQRLRLGHALADFPQRNVDHRQPH